eukprot:1155102-Pelagomonas_calceolata.AAC.7
MQLHQRETRSRCSVMQAPCYCAAKYNVMANKGRADAGRPYLNHAECRKLHKKTVSDVQDTSS